MLGGSNIESWPQSEESSQEIHWYPFLYLWEPAKIQISFVK